MITLRQAKDRGYADHGWLKSHHSFSFAGYYDPAHMGWGNLRVINDDHLAPGAGFATHGHQDMEIISYVVSGALEHKDSMGNGTVIPAGDVQRMSAGHGVRHSEYNHFKDQPTHFYQIWILPAARGAEPGYEQHTPERLPGQLQLLAAPDGAQGALTLHADARLYRALFEQTGQIALPLESGRKGYLHVVSGTLELNGTMLNAGDAALLEQEQSLQLKASGPSESLFFDLAV